MNDVVGVRRWEPTHFQFRSISTETRRPDPQPFPLPTQKPQQSNARAPPLPIPPQVPLTEPLKLPESGQIVSTDSAKATIVTGTPTTPDAKTSTMSVENKEKSEDKSKKKLTIWKRVKKKRFITGMGQNSLGKKIQISFQVSLKMAAGYELSVEKSSTKTTTEKRLDPSCPILGIRYRSIRRVVVACCFKLFPNIYLVRMKEEATKEAKRAALVKTRKDVSKLLRTTIQESGLYISTATKQSDEFSEFFRRYIP